MPEDDIEYTFCYAFFGFPDMTEEEERKIAAEEIAKAIMSGEVEWDKPKEWCDPNFENLTDEHWEADPNDPEGLLGIAYNTWDFPINKGQEATGKLRGKDLSLWCKWIEEKH